MNYLVVVDPDAARRQAYLEAWRGEIALMPGLTVREHHAGDCSMLFATAPTTPVDVAGTGDRLAVLLGRAHDGAVLQPASRLLVPDAEGVPTARDGLHVTIRWDGHRLSVHGDVLGCVPIYAGTFRDGVIVASSPELFKRHPAVHLSFDPDGLVGLLMTMVTLRGRTLFREVRRLAAGHVLEWETGTGIREVKQYEPALDASVYDGSLEGAVERLDRVMADAVRELLPPPGRSFGQMLSGGLDSRVVAGYLSQHAADRPVEAVTLGVDSDLELRCARSVAHALDFRHHATEIDETRAAEMASLQARWEQGLGGFANVNSWAIPRAIRGLADEMVTGYLLDSVIGGAHVTKALIGPEEERGFPRLWRLTRQYGLKDDTLARLLQPEVLGNRLQELTEECRATFDGYARRSSLRPWLFDLLHRQRLHGGRLLWVMSFATWPSTPALSRAVLDLVSAMPAAVIGGRRLQQDLVIRRFPALARLPIDRNSREVAPLVQPWQSTGQILLGRLRGRAERARRRLRPLQEPRRYFRIYDYNGTAWRAVRARAHEHRRNASAVLRADVLDEVTGRPDEIVEMRDGIVDSAGRKSVLGFLLWSADNL